MSNGKLVYTTDKMNPAFENNLQVGTVERKEILNEHRSSIRDISASLPNTKGGYIKMKKVNSRSIESLNRFKEQTTALVNLLSSGAKTPNQIAESMKFDTRTKYTNFMQRAREAADGIIMRKDGCWFITPAYKSSLSDLIEMMVKNRNAVWKNSLERKKAREQSGLPKQRIRSKVDQYKIDKIHKNISVDGKTFIQRFSSTGLSAELKIEPTVHASVHTSVSSNSLTIDIKW